MTEIIRFNSRTSETKAVVDKAILQGVTEVFNIDMLEAAKTDSPVLTGTNRRSLDASVEPTREGPKAMLYSQSGYGGYLEVGTRRMKAQPYMYPAFEKFWRKIPKVIKEILTK